MFGIKKPFFFGVDFGTSYIKAVELTLKNNLPTLVNYGHIEMSFTEGKNALFPTQSSEKVVHEYFLALLSGLKPTSQTVNVALPGFSGLVTLIELPRMSSKELDQAIQFEAHKYIPSRLEDVAFSWEVVPEKDEARKNMEVLLVAALRKEVAKYERYIVDSGVSVDLLELEIFSLVRAICSEVSGATLIVDIGSRATNIVLVRDGTVRLNRSVSAGGNEITSTLAESYGVSWERAEELKRGTKDFLNERESALSFPSLELITNEISRMLAIYQGKKSDVPVRSILLSGGTARMQGLSAYLSAMFGVPTSIADPWKGIQSDDAVRASLDRIGPSFSTAVGLALGGIERYRKK